MNCLSSLDREIISLQLGPLTNRVAVHLWPLKAASQQHALTSDTNSDSKSLFQPHVFYDGSGTDRPRLMAIDLPSSIDHGLMVETVPCDFGAEKADCMTWAGPVETVWRTEEPMANVPLHSAQTKWTACLTSYDRQTWLKNNLLSTTPEDFYNNTASQSCYSDQVISSFVQGYDLLAPNRTFTEETEDRIRHLMECCLRPSGIQLALDAQTAFVGMALRCMEYLTEEMPKRPILAIPVYDTRAIDPISRRLARANEMVLLTHLQSHSESLSHGAWLPIDVAAIEEQVDETRRSCRAFGLLAAALDGATSTLELARSCGGESLDQLLSRCQFGHSRRMLSCTLAHTLDGMGDDHAIRWSSLSPYRSRETAPTDRVLWRQVLSRGLPLESIQSKTSSDIAQKGFKSEHRQSNGNSEIIERAIDPEMVHPGSESRIISTLANIPHRTFTQQTPKHRVCQQPSLVRSVNVLEVPDDNSSEVHSLQTLVNTIKKERCYLPDGLEKDSWLEYLELAEERLVDTYCAD